MEQFIASTIVLSPMIKKIALSYGMKYMETPTVLNGLEN